ncbi:Rrf2 family transcriptional regulator [Terribacillus saccharophilus]|uniref:Rrf2 family transcriptional regulator n=1 Tax=Terribacillus saccharophilus TaxID=361277 RepID=UPI003981A113
MQLLNQAGDLGPKWFHVSLRILVLLTDSNTLIKSNQIAEQLKEDATFIRKILAKFVEQKYVEAKGGRYGGYQLIKNPKEITFKNVYLIVGNPQIVPYWSVPSIGAEQFISLVISKAERDFQDVLESYTLQDILDNKN